MRELARLNKKNKTLIETKAELEALAQLSENSTQEFYFLGTIILNAAKYPIVSLANYITPPAVYMSQLINYLFRQLPSSWSKEVASKNSEDITLPEFLSILLLLCAVDAMLYPQITKLAKKLSASFTGESEKVKKIKEEINKVIKEGKNINELKEMIKKIKEINTGFQLTKSSFRQGISSTLFFLYMYKTQQSLNTPNFKINLLTAIQILPQFAYDNFDQWCNYLQKPLGIQLQSLVKKSNEHYILELKDYKIEESAYMYRLQVQYQEKNDSTLIPPINAVLFALEMIPNVKLLASDDEYIYLGGTSTISSAELEIASQYINSFPKIISLHSAMLAALKKVFERKVYRPWQALFIKEDKNKLPNYLYTLKISMFTEEDQKILINAITILVGKNFVVENDLIVIQGVQEIEKNAITKAITCMNDFKGNIYEKPEVEDSESNKKPGKEEESDDETENKKAKTKNKTRSMFSSFASLWYRPEKNENILEFKTAGLTFNLDTDTTNNIHRIKIPQMAESNKLLLFACEEHHFNSKDDYNAYKSDAEKASLGKTIHNSDLKYVNTDGETCVSSYKMWRTNDIRVFIRLYDITIHEPTGKMYFLYIADGPTGNVHALYQKKNSY